MFVHKLTAKVFSQVLERKHQMLDPLKPGCVQEWSPEMELSFFFNEYCKSLIALVSKENKYPPWV